MLIIFHLSYSAQELELEDTQSQLQQDLRSRMAVDGKTQIHTTDLLYSI